MERARKRRVRNGVVALLCAVVVAFTLNRLTFLADTLERAEACGMVEHAHAEACFDETGALTCGLEAHVHTDACYQARPTEADVPEAPEAALESVEIELPPLEVEPFSLGDAEDALVAETPVPELAPEGANRRFVVGEQRPVYLGAILEAVGLAADAPVEAGQVVDDDHPEGMIWFERDERGLAIYPARSFERLELAVFTEDDVVIVELCDAVVPEAAPTPQATGEAPAPEDAVEPEATVEPEETAEPEETVEPEEMPELEADIEPGDTAEIEPMVPCIFDVAVDISDLEGPFSLRGWMTQARSFDASWEEAIEGSAETWRLDYDADLLSIEPVEDDYSVMPTAGFDETTILVDAVEALYRVTLLDRREALSEPARLAGTMVTAVRGADYWIEVTYDGAANIPDGARLSVTEVPEDDEAYAEGVDRMTRALSDANDLVFISDARLFDIDILYEGERIEPDAPVLVTVRYADPVPLEDDAVFEIVHLPEGDAEVLPIETMDGDVFSFETDSFSTFAFGQANYIGSLNGQSFAIVRDNGKDKVALLSEAENGALLKGTYVNVLEAGVLTAVTAANGKVASDVPITVWTFEHVRDNLYHIRSDDGRYMDLTTGALTVSDAPGLIEVYPIDASGNLSGYIRLRCADDTAYVVSNRWGSAAGGFQAAKSTDANTRFALYASVDNAVYPEFTAQKRSASELEGGRSYVIYQRVYNEEIGEYEDYVVAGDGSLVYAFDDGDYVGYRTDKSTTWYLYEYKDDDGNPTGYYDFYNPATGNYLAPQAGGILSKSPLGLLMDVSGANTTIEAWDDASKQYVGLSCDIVGRALTPCESGGSAVFSFAEAVEFETGVLHPVETVDSAAAGIKISMYDFSDRASMNLFNDDTWYQNGTFKQGLLKRVLGADGWPVSRTGQSFSKIYNSTNYKGDANHLFLQSVYDATGYYEYNAFNNFAHYDRASGDFTVYEETGIPQNGAGGSVSSYYRGNFLPYNNLDVSKPGTNTHLYDTLYGWVSLENPMFRDTMYLLKEAVDYQFGTVIEASFLQARDGLDANGAPVVYEFMGDDDLWVYIDGVLVLDIGGVHSSVSGYIDFSTGVVDAGGVKTTLRQAFKDAGIFPDGTAWNDSLADEYFQGDTFRDYSGHTMKMFYQERGSGASTLKVRFNLPVVESGTFAVEKKLSGTDQAGYANVQFAYQAFAVIDGQNVPLYPGVTLSSDPVAVSYEGGGAMDFHDGVPIGDKEYDHVFYLKPGEACVFSGIPDDVPYFVQEIDVSGAYYDTVMINEADMGGDGGIPEDEAITAISSAKTIMQRQRVQFVNRCSPANLKDLRVTKRVENPVDEQATFEFRVMLEGADGALTHYSRGKYYVVKEVGGEEHYFTYVDGVLTDQGTEPVVCSESGQYGTIAGIPDGYTVVIKGLLAGTDFLVEEIRNPTGYAFVSKELEDGSCDPAEVPGADGQIKLREDAKVTVTNHCLSSITVNKVWESGEYVAVHGSVTMALYRREGDAETLATRGAVLKSDPVQTIEAPSVSAAWLLELPADDSLENYVVREVVVEDGRVTPVADGETLVVPGETPGNTYVVSYAQGDVKTLSENDPYIQRRTDAVTNTRKQRLSFMKVDIANTEQPLYGAVFDLFRVNDSERVEPALLSGMISGDNGLLSYDGETVFELVPGTYQLVETAAPRGYDLKSAPITITVTADAVNYDEGSSLSSDGSGKKVDPETDTITLLISNTAGVTLPATGGGGSSRYTLSGFLLIALALLGLYVTFDRKKGK